MKSQIVSAVGNLRANCLLGCPLSANKDLKYGGQGLLDYCVDCNSSIAIAKWVDKKKVEVASNYIGIEPMKKKKKKKKKIKQWVKTSNSQMELPCPSIIQAYNKNMGVVDLVDILIALYQIKVRTKQW